MSFPNLFFITKYIRQCQNILVFSMILINSHLFFFSWNTTRVKVTITAVNEFAPVFSASEYVFNTTELAPLDLVLGSFEATDGDNDSLTYNLDGSESSGVFLFVRIFFFSYDISINQYDILCKYVCYTCTYTKIMHC